MQFGTLAVSLFAATAAATNTTLTSLVQQLPTCALSCFQDGASSANCTVTDFACLCGDGKNEFISSAGICLITASCSTNETSQVKSLATEICEEVADDPSSADVASASAAVTSAIGAASTSKSGAAATPMVGLGMMGGAAALAAWAM